MACRLSLVWLRRGALAALLVCSSCAWVVEYTDLLRNDDHRSDIVTKPAEFAGLVGFVIGVPIDILALPVTYPVYAISQDEDEPGVDPMSTLLFPSFFLQRTSILAIGAPLDMLELVFYRAWLGPTETDQFERDRAGRSPSDRSEGELEHVGTRGMD